MKTATPSAKRRKIPVITEADVDNTFVESLKHIPMEQALLVTALSSVLVFDP